MMPAVAWLGRAAFAVQQSTACLRRALQVVLPMYIGAAVLGAFWVDPRLGCFVSMGLAAGVAVYVPIRLLVTGRWWDVLWLFGAVLDGVLAGLAEQGRHHGPR